MPSGSATPLHENENDGSFHSLLAGFSWCLDLDLDFDPGVKWVV